MGTKGSNDTDAEEEVEAEEVRDAEAIHDVTYICSLMLILCGISTCKTYDIMRRVWAKTIAHAQKLQEYKDEDDLKINMPRATLVDIGIDDPSDVIGDTSIYDEAVYKVKSDLEVHKRRTVDDPAAEITRAAESVKGNPTTVIVSSYSTVESIKKTQHASLEITGCKNDDGAAPNRMILRQIETCERDLWTTTSIMIANLHQQLSQLNLCIIILGCFAFKNTPKTIKLFDLTDDPNKTLIDISEYDESVYKIKSDPEVYTIDDPAVEITRAAC